MAERYLQEKIDETGATFRIDAGEQAFMRYFWFVPAALLLAFAVQGWFVGEVADRPYAYGFAVLAAGFAAAGVHFARRPGPPAVLRFENATRTLRILSAAGRPVSEVPYADVGPFAAGRFSDSGPDGRGRTYYGISVTLRDGRRFALDANASEAVRDAQLADLRRLVTLPPGDPPG